MTNERQAGGWRDYVELVSGNRSYRFLWLGQVFSLAGDWFNVIATATLIQQLTGSSAHVGWLFAIRMLAPFLVSPFAGVVADRFDRRKVLIVSDILRAAVVLGFLVVDEPDEVWLLYALTFVQLALSGFFFPAYRALLPQVAAKHELGTAIALGSATWSTMLAAGAVTGGLVAGMFGVYPAFVIDALTFVVSVGFLCLVRPAARESAPVGGGLRASIQQYLDGWRYLRRHVDIALVALQKAANTLLVAGAFQVVQVALTEQVFVIGEGGSTSLGIMWSTVGIGTGIGPILVRRYTGDDPRRLRVALAISYFVTGTGLVLVAFAGSFPVALVGALLRGVGAGVNWVFSTQLLLTLVPDRVRGRVFSTEFAVLTLCSSAGSAVAGQALEVSSLGIQGTLLCMAGLVVVPGVLWSIWTARHPLGLPVED
jgi:MFS family permease